MARKRRRTLVNLTVEELLNGCEKALANGRELLDEATLLLEHGHAARSFALSQLAGEEAICGGSRRNQLR
jgi:hypothetical protein